MTGLFENFDHLFKKKILQTFNFTGFSFIANFYFP